jgi:L,D-peptidoglycan transpeptidase YkuD (ErfK/YbiS/YcfS/YnhG family)
VRDKREGDGGTPAGEHALVGMLYRPDRMARPAGWAVPIGPRDLWCDDPGHEEYNQMVRAPFQASHERLRRADRLYDLVILVAWNWPFAERGRGSAIFIHRWRRPGVPTEGCVAFRDDHLRWIAARIVPGTRLIVQP